MQLLSEMETECRNFIQDKGLALDVRSPRFNVPELCKALCEFMISKGFGPSHSEFRIISSGEY